MESQGLDALDRKRRMCARRMGHYFGSGPHARVFLWNRSVPWIFIPGKRTSSRTKCKGQQHLRDILHLCHIVLAHRHQTRAQISYHLWNSSNRHPYEHGCHPISQCIHRSLHSLRFGSRQHRDRSLFWPKEYQQWIFALLAAGSLEWLADFNCSTPMGEGRIGCQPHDATDPASQAGTVQAGGSLLVWRFFSWMSMGLSVNPYTWNSWVTI